MTAASPCLLLLGGSFNPPHIGHLRVALDGREALLPEKTLLIPAASPPHKPDAHLLPFAMRVDMLKKSIAPLPGEWEIEVCEVENERQGPSYTIDTLEILGSRHPGKRLIFIMGAEDYSQLATWRRWEELPRHADLAVIPRKHHEVESFRRSTLALWPEAAQLPSSPLPEKQSRDAPPPLCPFPGPGYALPQGGRCLYLPLPRIEVSSSLIRERFLAGLSLDFLVPAAVQAMLGKNEASIRSLWR